MRITLARVLALGGLVVLGCGLGGNASAAPAVPRQVTVYSNPLSIAPGQWGSYWVGCPAGTQVTDGGESNTSASEITLHDSYALSGNSGWQVRVTSSAGVAETVTLYAVCWSGLANYGPATAKVSVPSGGYADAQALCQSGSQVLGGGGFGDTLNDVVSTKTFGTGWLYGFQNNDSVPRTADAQVFCGSGVTHYQLVQGPDVELPSGQEATVTAYCPAGTWIVGGAGLQFGNYRIRLTDSQPNYGSQSWQASFHNDDPNSASIEAEVICGN